MLLEVVDAADIGQLVTVGADRLELLAELALVQVRQAVAAEGGVRSEDAAAADAGVVPLVGADGAGGRDGAQFQVGGDLVLQGDADAARVIAWARERPRRPAWCRPLR